MPRYIDIPVVLGGPARALWSENCKPNGIVDPCASYGYAASVCCPACTHPGHDVDCDFEVLRAATDSIVVFAGADNYYKPYHVDLQPVVGPFKGERHIYGHMSQVYVTSGQTVTKGQAIGVSGTAGTGPHLHFERRGVNACSLDPDPVLTSADANGGQGGEMTSFGVDDKLKIVDGPLNLRAGPGTGYAIVASLATNTELCVTGASQVSDGNTWYPVKVASNTGWVAGQYCTLVAEGGCKVAVGFGVGDYIRVVDGPVNLRAGAGLGFAVVASLAAGSTCTVLAAAKTAEGYTWQKVHTASGEGWLAVQFCELLARNRVANPAVTQDISYIFCANASTQTYISRVLVSQEPAIKVVTPGTATHEGVRFDSKPLSLAGSKKVRASVDVWGTGPLDYLGYRVKYSDGTFDHVTHGVAVTLTATRKRIVMPEFTSNASKTITKVELHARHAGTLARTFHADTASVSVE